MNMRIISILGKDGSGKTAFSLNLALALRRLRNSVALIDLNIENPHLGLYVDANPHLSINDFLSGHQDLEKVIYKHHSGLSLALASISADRDISIGSEAFLSSVRRVFGHYDFVILDTPGAGGHPDLWKNVSGESIIVCTPHIASAFEAAKHGVSREKKGSAWLVINRVRNAKHELTRKEMLSFTGIPLLGVLPEDDSVMESTNTKKPAMHSFEKSRYCRAVRTIASQLSRRQGIVR
jgi:septum site-determining protein MinD